MSLSNVSLVAFHYKSYGTFCIYSKRLHNLHGGFTHYRNYRACIESYRKVAFSSRLCHNRISIVKEVNKMKNLERGQTS